jgi:hypothetical protein
VILNKWVLFQAQSEVSYPLFLKKIFRSISKSGDYHDDMNHANYKKWLQEKYIPNFESKLLSTLHLTTMYSSTGTQPAMPEKVKCCSAWISMVYGTAGT